VRRPLPAALAAKQVWSGGCMTDAFSSGRKFRTMNIVDDYTRECLALEVDSSLRAASCSAYGRTEAETRLPRQIRSDNGPKFVSRAVDQWPTDKTCSATRSNRGRLMENGCLESFERRFGDERPIENWFCSLADAREKIAQWKQDYSEQRPHSSSSLLYHVKLAAQAAGFCRNEVGDRSGVSLDRSDQSFEILGLV
jgi:putative transposase